ncbi:MAG TPA: HEAT repeat domain-containing protein, partial [Pirellulaceae bacterium]|nr:HEAT repeat domain-containing protein [Pirellulaceae bacterium]
MRCTFALLLILGVALTTQGAPPPDLEKWTAGLASSEPQVQYAAADSLADLGIYAQPAIPHLVKALQGKDADLRWRAARALGAIGSEQAVVALNQAAKDAHAGVRAQVLFALGRIGAADAATTETIAAGLADPDAGVRRASVRALRMIQTDRKLVLPKVLKLLEDADPSVVMPALHTVAEAGKDVVPALKDSLQHPEARYWACLVLSEIGPEAHEAVPALTELLADKRPEVRLQATIALGEIGPAAKSAAPALGKLLQDEFPAVRAAAVFALGKIGNSAAAEAIARADQADDPFLHTLSVWAQAKLSPDDAARSKEAVTLLVSELGGEDRELAHLAARALADLGATNETVEAELDKVLMGADAATADRTITALASLGPRVVPHAIRGLAVLERRPAALRVLKELGPEAAPAVPNLMEILKGERDPQAQAEVLFVLAAVGPQAEPAVPAVATALGSADRDVVLTAAYCLGQIGPEAKAAVPELKKLLAAEDKLVQLT